MILTIIFSILAQVCSLLTGWAKAVADLSDEGKLKWLPYDLWLKEKSSNRKYKCDKDSNPIIVNGKKLEAFPLSTSLLVMFVDGWHRFETILTYSLLLAGYFVGYVSGNQSPFYSLLLAGVIATRMVTFHYFHDVLNILKQDKFHNMSISKGRKIAWGIFLGAIVIAAILSVVFCNILPHHVK